MTTRSSRASAPMPRSMRLTRIDNVEEIEASRPAGLIECATSVPFVKATKIHAPTVGEGEYGDRCLVAFIDSGIDILHAAFMDAGGQSRIVEIWDQAETGGTTPDSNPSAVATQLWASLHGGRYRGLSSQSGHGPPATARSAGTRHARGQHRGRQQGPVPGEDFPAASPEKPKSCW